MLACCVGVWVLRGRSAGGRCGIVVLDCLFLILTVCQCGMVTLALACLVGTQYVLGEIGMHIHSGPPACDLGVAFAGAGPLWIDAAVRPGRWAQLAVAAMVRRHQWSSGRIHRCHRCDPGSIPG